MRTQRGYRSLDAEEAPAAPGGGMHYAYDRNGVARYCRCIEFWEGNPDAWYYVAHEDYSSHARINLSQIAYYKENAS